MLAPLAHVAMECEGGIGRRIIYFPASFSNTIKSDFLNFQSAIKYLHYYSIINNVPNTQWTLCNTYYIYGLNNILYLGVSAQTIPAPFH